MPEAAGKFPAAFFIQSPLFTHKTYVSFFVPGLKSYFRKKNL